MEGLIYDESDDNPQKDAVQEAGYESSFCAFGGVVTAAADPYYLYRLGASAQRTLTDLRIDIDDAW